MKNYKKIIAGVIGIAITASAASSITLAKADESEDTTASSAASTEAESDTGSGEEPDLLPKREAEDGPVYKDETVYVVCSSESKIKNVIVSDWLRNAPALYNLDDISELQNIENVKGDEGFSTDGESLSWYANGNDIYYKGTTNKELPVDIEIEYFLDDVKVHPQDIKGRSGHLKIRWKYTNHAKVNATVNGQRRPFYVPFACINGAVFDSDKFLNATITSGKIISDGNRLYVLGIAFPGLNESLGIDAIEDFDAEIPEYVEFEADVLSFEMNTSVTAVSNELFSNFDFEADFNFGELKEQIDKLLSASNQLVDGTSEIYDGIAQLSSKTGSLTSGISKLTSGSLELSSGASKLSDGASKLSDGAKALSESTTELTSGIKSAKGGADQLVSGINKLTTGTSSLKSGIDSAKSGSSSLSSGLAQADKGADALAAGASDLHTGAVTLHNGTKELSVGITTAGNNLSATIAANETALAALQKAYKSAPTSDLAKAISTLQTTIDSQKQIAASMSSTGTLGSGAASVQKGAEQLRSSSKTLSANMNSLDSSIGKLSSGASSLDSGISKLSSGAVDLNSGFSSLKTGAASLDTGLGDLLTGSTQLEEGALQLYKSSGELSAGASNSAKGAKSLWTGADELKTGFAAYADGIKQLEAGSKELSDGAKKFNEEGLTKLSSALNEQFPTILDNLKAVRQVSKDYNNFSGIGSDMEGTVKFIYTFEGTN